MLNPPTTPELAAAAGISKSYASEIVNGKRDPSRALAIHILRKTGWRHKLLDGLTADQIDLLETVDPWSPSQAAA
jgi:transcriptional regulator with XRE-family HTH domain